MNDWKEKYINNISIEPYAVFDDGILYCGDGLEVMEKIPENSISLILTDPPWNRGKNYGVIKENLSYEEYSDFIKKFIMLGSRVSNNRLAIVLGSEVVKQWWKYFENSKLIIINKGAISQIKVNNLFLQWKALLTNCKSNIPLEDLWLDIKWPGEGYFFNEPIYGHPAMTPLKLMIKCINIFSNKNDIILDPFIGSGTMAVAALETNRKFIGVDLNKNYLKDMSVKRIVEAYDKKRQQEIFK